MMKTVTVSHWRAQNTFFSHSSWGGNESYHYKNFYFLWSPAWVQT